MRIRTLVAAAVLLTACGRAPETPERTAAAQPDSFASVYAEDAVLYPVNSPAVRGRAAIASMVRAGFATGSFTYALKILSVEASDPIAIETGQNIITFTPGPGAPANAEAYSDTIMYITIWRKVDGQWLISKDIGTGDRPAT
jgi:uncharacterized protein (TIGR02246 family)